MTLIKSLRKQTGERTAQVCEPTALLTLLRMTISSSKLLFAFNKMTVAKNVAHKKSSTYATHPVTR